MDVKTIIDRKQVTRNRQRAAALRDPGADFLYRAVVDDLSLRLSAVSRMFDDALLLVPESVGQTDHVIDPEKARNVYRVAEPALGNAEALGLAAARYDLAVSLLTLHETNDTPGIMAQIRRSLRPDGLFLACIPAGDTLNELRECLLSAEADLTGAAHARVLPFMDVRDAGHLLQRAGFALPVVDTETLTVRYDTMFHLMRDLRAMGATNTLNSRSRRFATRELFARAAAYYVQNHADSDGRIRATFSFVWMSGWVPHETQQKPLKPGSAANRLADFLGDKSRNG